MLFCFVCYLQEVHLQRYLIALTSCSSSLTKQYDTLVGTALVRLDYFVTSQHLQQGREEL